MHRRLTLTALVCVLALTVGCAKERLRAARAQGQRTKAAEALERRIAKFTEATSHMKGLAWMHIDSGERDWRTDAAVIVARPLRIRVDAMDALADVWAKAGSDGSTMWLYIPGKRKLYEGRASPRNIRRLASFELEPRDLVSVIAGSPMVAGPPGVLESGKGSERRFIMPGSGLYCRLAKGGSGPISSCVRPSAEGGGIDYEITFGDYRRVGSVSFPHSIEVRFPESGAGLLVKYSDVGLGGEIDPKAFEPPRSRALKTHRYSR